jgi:hypothetical protein
MSSEISSVTPEKKLSAQLRAVLLIVQADPELERLVMPHISLETESINWEKIYSATFCTGHKAAITWCFNLWTDRYRPRVNSFDAALGLDSRFKTAVLQAIRLRWGLVD